MYTESATPVSAASFCFTEQVQALRNLREFDAAGYKTANAL
jgi:hypothetical protein